MKKLALMFVLAAAMTLVSCGGRNTTKAAEAAQTEETTKAECGADCTECPEGTKAETEGCCAEGTHTADCNGDCADCTANKEADAGTDCCPEGENCPEKVSTEA